jgi:formamidopyrimidine-DNA glycosylase
MPEGPEVECTKRGLKPIIGRKIKEIKLTPLSQKYRKYKAQKGSFKVFAGKEISEIERKGKFLIFKFNQEETILNHLGMSGKWLLTDNLKKNSTTHPKAEIIMEEPPHAVFDDVRNFGQFRIFNNYEEVIKYRPIKTLGPDGLAEPFEIKEFIKRLSKSNYSEKAIGEALLNQAVVAGVGNIYKSETLYRSKIHPERKTGSLTASEKKTLGKIIPEVLQKAVESSGTTFDVQPFVTPEGETGQAQDWLCVYAREGEECCSCKNKIKKIVQGGRSTFFCPKCQK